MTWNKTGVKYVVLVALVAMAGCGPIVATLSDRQKEWAISVVLGDKRPRITNEVLTGTWKAKDGHAVVFGEAGRYSESCGQVRTGRYRLEGYKLVVPNTEDRWIRMVTRDSLQLVTADKRMKLFVRQP